MVMGRADHHLFSIRQYYDVALWAVERSTNVRFWRCDSTGRRSPRESEGAWTADRVKENRGLLGKPSFPCGHLEGSSLLEQIPLWPPDSSVPRNISPSQNLKCSWPSLSGWSRGLKVGVLAIALPDSRGIQICLTASTSDGNTQRKRPPAFGLRRQVQGQITRVRPGITPPSHVTSGKFFN